MAHENIPTLRVKTPNIKGEVRGMKVAPLDGHHRLMCFWMDTRIQLLGVEGCLRERS